MRVAVNDIISAFLLQAGKSRNKNITSFNLIHLQNQKKKIIMEMFIPTPTEYFTVKSGQEMDLIPVIAVNFVC